MPCTLFVPFGTPNPSIPSCQAARLPACLQSAIPYLQRLQEPQLRTGGAAFICELPGARNPTRQRANHYSWMCVCVYVCVGVVGGSACVEPRLLVRPGQPRNTRGGPCVRGGRSGMRTDLRSSCTRTYGVDRRRWQEGWMYACEKRGSRLRWESRRKRTGGSALVCGGRHRRCWQAEELRPPPKGRRLPNQKAASGRATPGGAGRPAWLRRRPARSAQRARLPSPLRGALPLVGGHLLPQHAVALRKGLVHLHSTAQHSTAQQGRGGGSQSHRTRRFRLPLPQVAAPVTGTATMPGGLMAGRDAAANSPPPLLPRTSR